MSQRIPPTFIQEVLTRSDIVEIIRSRVNLVQRGDNHIARCPFHEEKTPSFSVSHSKQFYYCFGCGAHGNAIGFLIEFDHLAFREAVSHLAARAGLEIPTSAQEDDSDRYLNLHQALERAMQYYQATLRTHQQAIQYLKSRGVSGITAKKFGLGYATADRQALQQYLSNAPDLCAVLAESGMVITKESQRAIDRFRDRIMFPIRNSQGQIIGFGGRTLGDAQPKYLNSPETPLFHKGAELYGLYEARQNPAKLSRLIVVEGYMDVIALHQHGITNAVATLGTAVTAKQVQKCLRYVNQLIFCFDGDRAGRQAAWKALLIALPLLREGIHIGFLFLPDTEDPDSLVRKIGTDAFSALMEQAVPLSEVFFNELKSHAPLNSPADKAQLGQEAAQYLNTMPHGLFRQLMYEQLAKELAMDVDALSALLQPSAPQTAPANSSAQQKSPGKGQGRRQTTVISACSQAIRILLQHSTVHDLNGDSLNTIDDTVMTADVQLLKQIHDMKREQPGITIGELLARIEDQKKQQMVAELAATMLPISAEEMQSEFAGALKCITQQIEEQEIHNLIEKAKKLQLNSEEKGKLQTLLAKLKMNASER